MKTLRLLALLEADSITGPAKNLLSFAAMTALKKTDPSIEVSIAVYQRSHSSNVFLEKARQCSIPVYTIPESGRFDRSVIERMKSLARELRPDIVQSHAVKSHFLFRLAALNKVAPWIAFHHGYTWTDLTMRLYNQLDRWSLRAADRVVTMSLPFRQQLARNGVDLSRIEVVHNAINPAWSSEFRTAATQSALRRQLKIADASRVLLIVGRLSLEKDHLIPLEAMHLLAEMSKTRDLPATHLVIVGDGPERGRIEKMIRRFNLTEAVTLTGQVASAEPYYAIADIALISSRTEGSPNALLESMAARVPVVATAVGGVPEIATDNETALLIPPRDAHAMSQAIASLLIDHGRARRLTEAAYQCVVTRFTPEVRTQRLLGIYQDVVQRRALAPDAAHVSS
jgi:glycosyltransferase involved in cell wall biosynthesis